MFFIYFLFALSYSLSKYVCFDSIDGGKCDFINEQFQNKFIKYSINELNNLFNESVESLNLAIFQKLESINVPNDYILDEFSIISDFQEIEIKTKSESLTLKKLNVQNTTIKFATNSDTTNILNITNNFIRNNAHFLSSNEKILRLAMRKCDSFLLLQDFDEFEIDILSSEQSVPSFTFPLITSDCFINLSIKVILSEINLLPNDFSLVLFSGKEEDSLLIKSKSYSISKSSSFIQIKTTLPFTYIHNYSNSLDIYINNDYCDKFSQEQNRIKLEFYSGIARFHNGCDSKIGIERSSPFSFLINSLFYNDSSIEINQPYKNSILPISIISSNNLNIQLNQQFSSILGYLYIENGNITIQSVNKNSKNFHFSCSSFVNFSEKVYNDQNEQLFSYIDLTEAEFYESITHLNLTQYIILDENVIFNPKFLLNTINIINGTTVSNFINEDCTGIDFNPQTKLMLKENGTIVVPYHLNFNETYEGVMKIHHDRYDYLSQRGENRTFNLDDFYNSFKYYYIKYMPVFDNFSKVFIKTFNQFYPPKMINDQQSLNSQSTISIVNHHNEDLNHFVRLFIKRDDSPINSWYHTQFMPLICNISMNNDSTFSQENIEIEFSNSLVSEFAKIGEFKLDGEINFNETSSCIEYRVKNPPTSSSEFFAFLINNDLIDSAKHIPFISIITPTTINNFYNLMRNSKSRNVLIVVCESMTDKIDFTKLRSDANIFICSFSIKHMNEMIDFFNTIRKGNDFKKDLKKALEKISPKIPEILPIVKVKILESQSLTAVGVTIENSLIKCGSLTMALCSFGDRMFVGATNLITDLYSIQNLLLKTKNFRFLNVSLIPDFIGNKGGTTDLLSITKIEFDENSWFFYSKGTIYDNVIMNQNDETDSKNHRKIKSPSYNFGIPYIIAENDFFVYSITDSVDFSLIQSEIQPKALHFISGEKVNKMFLKEKISILSESDNLVEIPESTHLTFSGKWDIISNSEGQFSFEFGNSNAIVDKIPYSVDIIFSGGKNVSIDCNQKNQKIKALLGNGPISVDSIDGFVSIDSFTIKPFDKTFLNANRENQFLQVSKIECEQHSKASLNDISLQKIILNPDSFLEATNFNFEPKASLKFNYNYDYDIPLLIINNSINIDKISSIVMNYSRKHHSQYNPSFEKQINKSKTFLKITNSKCTSFNDDLFDFKSDFSDFNGQKYINLQCEEKGKDVEFSIKLIEMPSLKLLNSKEVVDSDQIIENPLNPPYLYIPTPSATPKENDMTAAIIGGSVGGVAFLGIIAFVVYFILSGRKDDEALLNSLERRNARGEGEGIDDTIENTIGASVENSANDSIESEEKKTENLNQEEENQNLFKDDLIEKP